METITHTNDPGLDDPIAEDAKDVDVVHQKKDEKEEKEEDKQAFLKPRVSRVNAVFDMSVKTIQSYSTILCALSVTRTNDLAAAGGSPAPHFPS